MNALFNVNIRSALKLSVYIAFIQALIHEKVKILPSPTYRV